MSATPVIVLDTNVVMDWLVFRDPVCDALACSLSERRLHWIATAAMRDELAHVLARGVAAAWQPDSTAIWQAWQQHATEVPAVAQAVAGTRLRCTDPLDQMFIDLALAHRAQWLFSHDRAVLKLAKRARVLGLEIVSPRSWSPPLVGGRLPLLSEPSAARPWDGLDGGSARRG